MTNDEKLAEIRAMLAEVLERLNAPLVTDAMLTSAEAFAYVKVKSASAFHRWRTKWGVTTATHGRWSRAKLDLALAREAGLVRTPATLRRRW